MDSIWSEVIHSHGQRLLIFFIERVSPCSFIHLYWAAFKRFTLRKILLYPSSRYINLYYFLVAINHSVLRSVLVFNHRFGLRNFFVLTVLFRIFLTYSVVMIRTLLNKLNFELRAEISKKYFELPFQSVPKHAWQLRVVQNMMGDSYGKLCTSILLYILIYVIS